MPTAASRRPTCSGCSRQRSLRMDRPHRSEATMAPSSSPERFSNGFRENKIKTIYIDPGCPWSRSCGRYAESFNSPFRVECLERELLYTLSESGVVLADWRDSYNPVRPHRSLGLQSPSEYARNQSDQGLGSGRPTGSHRPEPPTKQHQHSEDLS